MIFNVFVSLYKECSRHQMVLIGWGETSEPYEFWSWCFFPNSLINVSHICCKLKYCDMVSKTIFFYIHLFSVIMKWEKIIHKRACFNRLEIPWKWGVLALIELESRNHHQSFLLVFSEHLQNFSSIRQLLFFTLSKGPPFALKINF